MPENLSRILEPEVMDTEEEARDYDAMDHAEVNRAFCSDLLAAGIGPTLLDVGTGTARIPIELCARVPDVRIVAVDLADHMLALAAKNIARAGVEGRVALEKIDAKRMPFADGTFATTVSNTIVHHIADPRSMIAECVRVTEKGGLVFIRDLARPSTDAEVERLVTLHMGPPPIDPTEKAAFERQEKLFAASLRAAFTLDEIVAIAKDSNMTGCSVAMTSDRHWTLSFRKP